MKNACGALILSALLAPPAWGQTARPPESLSEPQRAEFAKLMRAYVDSFRILGRAKVCGHNHDPEPHLREVARRHGEKSYAVEVAWLGFAAGAENRRLDMDLEPVLVAPMPCDVVFYMKDMRLPALPASLALP